MVSLHFAPTTRVGLPQAVSCNQERSRAIFTDHIRGHQFLTANSLHRPLVPWAVKPVNLSRTSAHKLWANRQKVIRLNVELFTSFTGISGKMDTYEVPIGSNKISHQAAKNYHFWWMKYQPNGKYSNSQKTFFVSLICVSAQRQPAAATLQQ